ncbi:hypothetical protein CV_0640 [Chromobacterium violaceum ATCC 12472]|uniref:Uncharacterized protein n=1 Tax=Chromobacterium violaceum (strain ATCC 12472 / DSM 30191 / JCM 1249 / CCUG 213 / NBRC 12614 / NCIMB 9131 / NCTC 9757 / MK) TaxID=243365 RepID=Q7P0C7_CHRVO|nr:hypothetical protein CV_0640 [Chromobacterium violaceum ATCC 12472]
MGVGGCEKNPWISPYITPKSLIVENKPSTVCPQKSTVSPPTSTVCPDSSTSPFYGFAPLLLFFFYKKQRDREGKQ